MDHGLGGLDLEFEVVPGHMFTDLAGVLGQPEPGVREKVLVVRIRVPEIPQALALLPNQALQEPHVLTGQADLKDGIPIPIGRVGGHVDLTGWTAGRCTVQ